MTVNAGDIIRASDINSAGMIQIAGTIAITSSAAIGATETAVLTIPSATYPANGAYWMVVSGGVSVSVGNNTPLFRFRKTDASGQQLDVFRVPCIVAATTHGVHYGAYFQVGASDITAPLALTLAGTASFNATLSAAGTSPATFNVFRAGDASRFANAPTLI